MTNDGAFSAEGRCTCGKVRYRMTARPMFVHCCHCTWCQRESGSAFALNAIVEEANVDLVEGTVAETDLPSNSGKGQTRTHCPDCGVTLWSKYHAMPARVRFVRVGTLDDPTAVAPDIHIYTSTKQPWVALPDDVPAVEEFYRLSKTWPADSLERFQAVRDT